jgi:predicted nucleotidyltransferase component of viral defense system
MNEIPLILKLKKKMHKDIASAQDIIIQELYNVFNNAVLHGGTAFWRCFDGNRFSEDVDVYINKDKKKIEDFFSNLEKQGFEIKKKKVGENSLYSVLVFNRTIVRFEALFKKINGSLKEYKMVDGRFITIYTLSPEDLFKEKVNTYIKRLKIRDLYDVFFLLRHIEDKTHVKDSIKKFVRNFKKPLDEDNLKIIIFEGLVPETEKMFKYINSFLN